MIITIVIIWRLTPKVYFRQYTFPWLSVWEVCLILFYQLYSEPCVRARVAPATTDPLTEKQKP